MTTRQPRYPMDEFARRGDDIYDREIRAQVDPGHRGQIVAIDIETGAYELGKNELEASKRLLDRNPDAQIWIKRVGYPTVHRFGWRGVEHLP
jgi:hypothetical protein